MEPGENPPSNQPNLRDMLGRMVRLAWMRWARTQPNVKASWLVPYDELSEADQEADRQIGEAVVAACRLSVLTVGTKSNVPLDEAGRPILTPVAKADALRHAIANQNYGHALSHLFDLLPWLGSMVGETDVGKLLATYGRQPTALKEE